MADQGAFGSLVDYLQRIPAVHGAIGSGYYEDGLWWVKFSIDTTHALAWHAVQELGHVLNYLSLDERLPTTFMPVSPPTYLNGGPSNYLSWVIECHDSKFTPGTAMEWLEGRLPSPVDDVTEWTRGDDS
jgi:hypothetical protein